MGEDKLNTEWAISRLSSADLNQYPELQDCKAVLRAASGLTLSEALARLKSPASSEPYVRMSDVINTVGYFYDTHPDMPNQATLLARIRALATPASSEKEELIVGVDESSGPDESVRVEIVECPKCKYRMVIDVQTTDASSDHPNFSPSTWPDHPDKHFCPTCGHEVRVVQGDEGTGHYEPVEDDSALDKLREVREKLVGIENIAWRGARTQTLIMLRNDLDAYLADKGKEKP